MDYSSSSTRKNNNSNISILMFPWLGYSHVSSYLELAKNLAKRNFHIYFCSTPVNLASIKPKLSENYSNYIEFVELHLPHLPQLPPHYHTSNGLPPHLQPTLKIAFDMAQDNFSQILQTLKPDLLVYDFYQPWASSLASLHHIPGVLFQTIGAACASFGCHYLESTNPFASAGVVKFPFPTIYLLDGHEFSQFEKALWRSVNGITMGECLRRSRNQSSDIILMKTFREIEGKYIDLCSKLMGKKIVPVGPLVQEPILEYHDVREIEIINWLTKKERSSVVFVCFGSENFLSEEYTKEIAYGLELSKVSFVWVIRFPLGERNNNRGIDEVLPQGFLERVGERGLVVEGWTRQAKILGHSSVGGFVSHCGWSSVMESMKHGVPIIAMPLQHDQPLNARLVEELGVGVEVKKLGEANDRVERNEVAKVIRYVVVEENGVGVKKRALELRDTMKKKEEQDIDEAVVEELVQLCKKMKTQLAK